MDGDTIITQKINPYVLAMTGGMLLDNDCPSEITDAVMSQIIHQLRKQNVNINKVITQRQLDLPPVVLPVVVGRIVVPGAACGIAPDASCSAVTDCSGSGGRVASKYIWKPTRMAIDKTIARIIFLLSII